MTPGQYKNYMAKARKDEEMRLALDRRTVDAVNTGEQQPEADHFMEHKSSSSGNYNGEPWRDASNGGYFSYKMKTSGADNLLLRVRYWGNESGNRDFDICIDDKVLASENTSGKWKKDEFVDQEYAIPSEFISGKDFVTVKFQSKKNNVAGGIFHVRLIRPEK